MAYLEEDGGGHVGIGLGWCSWLARVVNGMLVREGRQGKRGQCMLYGDELFIFVTRLIGNSLIGTHHCIARTFPIQIKLFHTTITTIPQTL